MSFTTAHELNDTRTVARVQDRGPPATKDQILAQARAEIGQGEADLEGRNLEDSVRNVAIMLQEQDINLSNMNITELPEELVDLIKNEASRLALHRNALKSLSGITLRLHECTKLKYLVLRENELREFPRAILGLSALEALDIKHNKLEAIPEDISRLTRLRTLSLSRNRIKKLPVCIAFWKSLQVIDAILNPIVWPPPQEWSIPDDENTRSRLGGDSIDTDKRKAETIQIKRFLQEYAALRNLRGGTDGEQSESNPDVPRLTRRKTNGRPPIRPSVSNIDIPITTFIPPSPRLSKLPASAKMYTRPADGSLSATPPTGPSSAQSLRPGLAPLINERNRSSSESHMPLSIKEKRMGMAPRRINFQHQLDQKSSNRLSHNRGVSHGSALHSSSTPMLSDSSSPPSPVEVPSLRSVFGSRLSTLPEYKRKSHLSDPMVEFARGILFSLSQVAIHVDGLLEVLRKSNSRNTSHAELERSSFDAFDFLRGLNRQIEVLERLGETDEEEDRRQSHSTLYSSCESCLRTYSQLGVSLKEHIRGLVTSGSQQYVRTLMHTLYSSLIEVRNACKKLGNVDFRSVPLQNGFPDGSVDGSTNGSVNGSGIGTLSSSTYYSPADEDRPANAMRNRAEREESLQKSVTATPMQRAHHKYQGSFNTISRAASSTAFSPATPLSTASLSTYELSNPSSAGPTADNSNTSAVAEQSEEKKFIDILHRLEKTCSLTLHNLSVCKEALGQARTRHLSVHDADLVEVAYERCRNALGAAQAVRGWLPTFPVSDPQARSNLEFWQLCTAFTHAFYQFASQLRHNAAANAGAGMGLEELKVRIKPLQPWFKVVVRAINESPWASLANPSTSQTASPHPAQSPPPPVHAHGFASPPSGYVRSATNSNTHRRNQQSVHRHYAPQHKLHQSLSIQTRGGGVPLPPTLHENPVGHSAISPTYAAPIPATPMHAALGIAATAMQPAVIEVANGGGSYFDVHATHVNQTGQGLGLGQTMERQKSANGKR